MYANGSNSSMTARSMQRTDRRERNGVRRAAVAAHGSQQQRGFNRDERDLPLPESTNQAQVVPAQTAWRLRRSQIEIEHRLAVSFRFLVVRTPLGVSPGGVASR